MSKKLGEKFTGYISIFLSPDHPLYKTLGVVAFKGVIRLCQSLSDNLDASNSHLLLEFWKRRDQYNKDVAVHIFECILSSIANAKAIPSDFMNVIEHFTNTVSDTSALNVELIRIIAVDICPKQELLDKNWVNMKPTYTGIPKFYIENGEVARKFFDVVIVSLLNNPVSDAIEDDGMTKGQLIKGILPWYGMQEDLNQLIVDILLDYTETVVLPFDDKCGLWEITQVVYEHLYEVTRYMSLDKKMSSALGPRERICTFFNRCMKDIGSNTMSTREMYSLQKKARQILGFKFFYGDSLKRNFDVVELEQISSLHNELGLLYRSVKSKIK
jgi:hypothetical protein